MLQQVLSVRRTIFHSTNHFNKFWMQVMVPHIYYGTLTYFIHLLLYLFCCLFYHFLNSRPMDSTIGCRCVEGESGDFTSNRSKTRQNNGHWSLVYNSFH